MSAPSDLRAAIERSLAPTRPLPSPEIRTLWLVPVAVGVVVSVPLLHAFRPDLVTLGWARSWLLTLLEAVTGLAIIRLALRESIPGRAVPMRTLILTFVAGLALPIVLLLITETSFAVGPPPGRWLADGMICFRASAGAAVPALIAASILVARGFPVRPGTAGGLYGLGCGLVADAGLRLFCHYSTPSHIVTAHLGAIIVCVFAGALAARFVGARARNPSRRGAQ